MCVGGKVSFGAHPGQPKHRIDCPERNRSIGTKNYLDISDRFWKIVFAKSNLSLCLDIYLHVTTYHQLLEGVYLGKTNNHTILIVLAKYQGVAPGFNGWGIATRLKNC